MELADLVALLHGAFIAFVVIGVVLGCRALWPRQLLFLAGLTTLFQETLRLPCPLTVLEAKLRLRAAKALLEDGFAAHYVKLLGLGWFSERHTDVLSVLFGTLAIARASWPYYSAYASAALRRLRV